MAEYARNTDRPIDVLFVGGYTRYHMRRAELLSAMAASGDQHEIAMHLDSSRLTKFAESAAFPYAATPDLCFQQARRTIMSLRSSRRA